jgi:hypothetical protein
MISEMVENRYISGIRKAKCIFWEKEYINETIDPTFGMPFPAGV